MDLTSGINEFIQVVRDVGIQLSTATPEILVGFFAILVGYGLKAASGFPRRAIPLAVMFFTALVYPWTVTDDFRASFHMKHPQVRIVIIGAIIGFVAWAVHYIFLKKLIDRFLPVLDGVDPQEEPKTPNQNENNKTP